MIEGTARRVHRSSALCALGMVLAGCASTAPDPFDRSDARGGRSHAVLFEVSCDECQIEWSVGHYAGIVSESGIWSHWQRVWVTGDGRESATLAVTPRPGAKPITFARISVDGKIAANEEGSPAPELERSRSPRRITIRTTVPASAGSPIVAGRRQAQEVGGGTR